MDTNNSAGLLYRRTDSFSLLPALRYLPKIELPKTGAQREKNQTQKTETQVAKTQAGRGRGGIERLKSFAFRTASPF